MVSSELSQLGALDLELEKTQEQDPSDGTLAAHLTQSHVEAPISPLRELAFVAVLCSAQLMTQAGLGQVVAPLHIIGSSFGITSPGELSWFPAAYSLMVGTFILIAGRLGDLYGHKRFFVAGFLWFGLWSLLAGFSVYSQRVFFDVCLAMMGIGPAFMLPNAVAILGRTYKPGLRKQLIFSAFGATSPAGFVLGAVFSSLLAQKLWWPWGFWIMAIACLLLAVGGIWAIPPTPTPVLNDEYSAWTRVDILGSITGITGLVLVNFAWNQAGNVGWTAPYTYVLLIFGVGFLGLFGYVESKVSTFPLVPVEAMSLDTGFLLACIMFGWASFGIWMFYTSQFLEELRGISPLLMSAQFTPVIISGLCAAFTTGFLMSHVSGSVVMICALTAFLAGNILVATAPVNQTYWAQIFVAMIVMPWGM